MVDPVTAGGMGVIWRFRDPGLGRRLAVKLQRPDLAGDPWAVRRFLEEARIAGQLQHPGVVPVHELGETPDGLPYFTMKLARRIRASAIRGRIVASLDDWAFLPDLKDWTAERDRILSVCRQVRPGEGWEPLLRDPAPWDRDPAALGRLNDAVAGLDPARVEPATLIALGRLLPVGDRITLWSRSLTSHPGDFWLHMLLGTVFLMEERFAEAEGAYRAALAVRRGALIAHLFLGIALNHQGKHEAAIREYRAAIRLRPDYPEAHNNLGIALADRGDRAEAIREYKIAIRLKTDYSDPHFNLGNALLEEGDLAGTIRAYREAVRLVPGNPTVRYNLSHALIRQGDLAGAIRESKEALSLKPDYPEA